MRNKAKIYGRDSTRKLTDYQIQINAAATELAIENVNFLESRHLLLQTARDKVHQKGYVYKKGKSRSKVINPETPKKRVKTTESG